MTDTSPRPWLASYAANVPTDIPEQNGTLGDLVDGSAEHYPGQVALEFFGATTTYRQLQHAILRVAEGLRARGVSKGDRVAIVLPNCPEHIVAFYAVLRLGAIVVEHNPLYTPRELRHQFEDHGARVAIVWNKVVATVQDFPEDIAVSSLISVDITRSLPFGMRVALTLPIAKARESREALTAPVRNTIPWSTLSSSRTLDPAHPGPESTDVAILQYTSGTTGTPKGAVLTHANLLANAVQARAWTPTIEHAGCTVHAVLPMFHAYGLTLCVTFAMSLGARLVLFPKFDPDLVLKAAKKHPPTFLPAVPPIAERLLARAKETGASLQGLEIGITGAMALPHDLVVPFEEATGGYLIEGYGLSECSPVLMANPVSEQRKPGTVGLPLPSTEVRVVDPENPTVDVEQGSPGELIVRGPQVFSGYYRKPDETSDVFVDGGWFRTGDIVTMDADGFVSIVDRIKELIITGGFNVAPTEVENALRQHPAIRDVAVVGMPSAHSGEDVVAAVVLEPGEKLDRESIRQFARDNLTPYKVPRRIVTIEALPTSLIGKVLRKQVRDQLLQKETGRTGDLTR
ncbi:long-chain fatty acid--CoA ligase [Mycetocola manganoxydans]|uniref:Long-chain fatty acid--CoA ligase n=1 Tax=Mycetocola manganoxydans TaxID=699879 RepID=A0A3L6ZUX8_9MICO|nr:long-chain-fatty-acid--CoA ligase [Mycetocola manganoxydans]RLP71629.1 long-chain fatty acid--CoA ligase [Mycetocola manganoxydans]GHD38773.1 long-chain-fatty-acid--CoA ligase [Mycetocola manganoxydans]